MYFIFLCYTTNLHKFLFQKAKSLEKQLKDLEADEEKWRKKEEELAKKEKVSIQM